MEFFAIPVLVSAIYHICRVFTSFAAARFNELVAIEIITS
jgi:hypothetical protein